MTISGISSVAIETTCLSVSYLRDYLDGGDFVLHVLIASTIAAAIPGPKPPVDTLLDVGGHRLHFSVYPGTKPLTVLMESGGGATVDQWRGLGEEIATRTGATVVMYDRAGFGRSDLGPADLTPLAQIHHLNKALGRLGAPSRRLIVGASYGGLMAIAHGGLYRDQVVGLVLLDPMNSRFVDATGNFVYSTVPQITEPKNDVERAIMRMVSTFDQLVAVARRAEPTLTVEMVIVSASRPPWRNEPENNAWRASHVALATATSARRLLIAENSGHSVAADRPDVVIEAVLSLMDSTKD